MEIPTVGVFKQLFHNYCPRMHLKSWFECKYSEFRIAFAYLQCLCVKNYKEVLYSMQDNSNRTGVSNITIYPFLVTLSDKYFKTQLYTLPVTETEYGFFTMGGLPDAEKRFSYNPKFLLNPLTAETWILLLILLMLNYGLVLYSEKCKRALSFNVSNFSLVCLLGILLNFYGSNLKAMSMVRNNKLLFTNIDELAALVAQKKVTLISENLNTTYIWLVLKGQMLIDKKYPEKLKKLYNSTMNNPR